MSKCGKPDNNLKLNHPELIKEWDYRKNIKPPEYYLSGSAKRVWWLCDKGHEWDAEIRERTSKKGRTCPYCNGQKPYRENNLAVNYPDIAKEWHPTLNGDLTPYDVLGKSAKKVWWLCKYNHKWDAVIHSRTRDNGTGCPECASSLQTSIPEIIIYYYFKNIFNDTVNKYISQLIIGKRNVEIDVFIPQLNVAIEYDGNWHSKKRKYDESKNKILNKNNIKLFRIRVPKLPILNDYGSTVFIDESYNGNKYNESLRKAIYLIGKYIIANFNDKVSDEQVAKLNELKTIDIESNIHEFINIKGAIFNENSLQFKSPSIAEEWHFEKNKTTPDQYPYASNIKVWWIGKCGYEWDDIIANRTVSNYKCPYCSGRRLCKENSLGYKNPEIAKEWDYEKNDKTPFDYAEFSNETVWWICSKNNEHKWDAKISNRSNFKGCPFCSSQRTFIGDSILIKFPEIASEWNYDKNGNLKPEEILPNSNKKVWWKCNKLGHEYLAIVQNRTKHGDGCPYCSGKRASKEYNLKVTHPNIAEMWDFDKNGNLTPEQVTKGSDKKVWWKCNNGHNWQLKVVYMTKREVPCKECKKQLKE